MAKSFFEVLEEQIRNELRNEIENEIRSKLGQPRPVQTAGDFSGRLETWLATHVDKTVFAARDAGRKAYGSLRPKTSPSTSANTTKEVPRVTARPKPAFRPEAIADLCAAELLRRHGGSLGEEFTESELKTAWRKAALQTHPDRFAQADQITQARMAIAFRELCDAYEQLLLAVKQALEASAAA